MDLSELKKSTTEMSTAELLEHFMATRNSRRGKPPGEKIAKSKTPKAPPVDPRLAMLEAIPDPIMREQLRKNLGL